DQFALQRISAALLEPCLGPGEEGPPPLLDHLRRNLDLSTDLPMVFAPQEPQHDLRLPLRTPALGQLPRAVQLPFRQHASDLLWTPSSTPKRCPRKSGAIYSGLAIALRLLQLRPFGPERECPRDWREGSGAYGVCGQIVQDIARTRLHGVVHLRGRVRVKKRSELYRIGVGIVMISTGRQV